MDILSSAWENSIRKWWSSHETSLVEMVYIIFKKFPHETPTHGKSNAQIEYLLGFGGVTFLKHKDRVRSSKAYTIYKVWVRRLQNIEMPSLEVSKHINFVAIDASKT